MAELILEGKTRQQIAPSYAIGFDGERFCIFHDGREVSVLTNGQSTELINAVLRAAGSPSKQHCEQHADKT